MANHAAQIRAEHGAGKPVHRRGRNFIEFSNGDGSITHVATIDPLHVRGSTTEIDTTFVPDAGAWQWKLAAADFEVHARSMLNAGDIIQWVDLPTLENVTVQPLALNWVNNANDSRQQIALPQAVAAQANDCVLLWPDGYGPGISFRYTAHPKRLIKHVIIDSPSRLPTPTVANPYLEVEFILSKSSGVTYYVDGAAWDNSTRKQTANRVEVRQNSTGEVLWYIDAPIAEDSSALGSTVSGYLTLLRRGASRYVTVRFPKAWFDTAVYPVYVDDSFTDGYGGGATTYKDTWIVSTAANNNGGLNTNIVVGGTSVWRSLIQFDVSSIPGGATLSSATMSLYCVSEAGGTDETVNAHRALVEWFEGNQNDGVPAGGENASVWNYRNYNGSVAWGAAGGQSGTDYTASATDSTTITAASAWYDWDVLADASAWYAGTATNYGLFCIGSLADGTQRKRFASSDYTTDASLRPKLVVVYTSGAATPAIDKTEGVTLGEAASALLPDALAGEKTDGTALGEQAQAALGDLAASASEGVTVGEAASPSLPEPGAFALSVSDGVALGESAQAAPDDLGVMQSEGATLGEASAAETADVIGLSEGVSLGETASALLPDALAVDESETVAAGEIVLVAPDGVLALYVSDGLALGEAAGLAGVLLANVTDGVSLGETSSLARTVTLSAADGVTLAESATVSLPEAFTASLTDGVAVGEQAAVALPFALGVTVADGTALGESASGVGAVTHSLTDGVSLGETATVSLPEALSVAAIEALQAGDGPIVSTGGFFWLAVSDGVTVGAAALVSRFVEQDLYSLTGYIDQAVTIAGHIDQARAVEVEL